ncbi:hypothetical protein SprV_0200710400 [Sparganum proliferum]
MDNSTSLQYTRHTEELRAITQHVIRDLDPEDDLIVLRIRTRLNEIMVLPGITNDDHTPNVRLPSSTTISIIPAATRATSVTVAPPTPTTGEKAPGVPTAITNSNGGSRCDHITYRPGRSLANPSNTG